jgi:uncharacterized membrane protein HdeD (DUF308 family)
MLIDSQRRDPMRNSQVSILALVIGVLALIVGVLYVANLALGYHPTRGYVLLAVGVILIIIGIVARVNSRSRRL